MCDNTAAVAVNNDGTSFKIYYTHKLHRLITKIVQELQRKRNSNATQRTGHRQKVINGNDSQVTIVLSILAACFVLCCSHWSPFGGKLMDNVEIVQ